MALADSRKLPGNPRPFASEASACSYRRALANSRGPFRAAGLGPHASPGGEALRR
jgi:hypothetical protein